MLINTLTCTAAGLAEVEMRKRRWHLSEIGSAMCEFSGDAFEVYSTSQTCSSHGLKNKYLTTSIHEKKKKKETKTFTFTMLIDMTWS